MPFCSNCGNKLNENDVFCDNCGAKQPPKTPSAEKPTSLVAPAEEKLAAEAPVGKPGKVNPPVKQDVTGSSPVPETASSKKHWGMVALVSLLVLGLIVIGSLYGVGVSNLNQAHRDISDLQTQLTTEKANVTQLELELTQAENEVVSLTSDLTAANNQVAALTGDLAQASARLTTLTADLNAANSQISSLTSDLSAANDKVSALTTDLAAANGKVSALTSDLAAANQKVAGLETQVTTLQTQLTAIQAKYPLEDFPDYAALSAWVNGHIQPVSTTYEQWYANALRVQQLAADDGYYIAPCLLPAVWSVSGNDFVYNTALAGGTLYLFDCEDPTFIVPYNSWSR